MGFKNYTIRLPEEIRARLQKVADRENRSLGNLIIHILTQYIKGKK